MPANQRTENLVQVTPQSGAIRKMTQGPLRCELALMLRREDYLYQYKSVLGKSAKVVMYNFSADSLVQDFIMILRIYSEEPRQFEQSLDAHGLSTRVVREKSISEVQAILLSIGGGAGIAAVLQSLGQALKSYYDGLGSASKDRKNFVKFKVGDLELECTADNVDAIMGRVLGYLRSQHPA